MLGGGGGTSRLISALTTPPSTINAISVSGMRHCRQLDVLVGLGDGGRRSAPPGRPIGSDPLGAPAPGLARSGGAGIAAPPIPPPPGRLPPPWAAPRAHPLPP